MNFWDTSALIRCAHGHEDGHGRALNLLRQKVRHCGSVFLALESVAAISRASSGDAATRRRNLNWLRLQLERFDLVEVRQELIDHAVGLSEKHLLRAGDALHLATALSMNLSKKGRRRLVFVTCDADQASAVEEEGLRVVRPDR